MSRELIPAKNVVPNGPNLLDYQNFSRLQTISIDHYRSCKVLELAPDDSFKEYINVDSGELNLQSGSFNSFVSALKDMDFVETLGGSYKVGILYVPYLNQMPDANNPYTGHFLNFYAYLLSGNRNPKHYVIDPQSNEYNSFDIFARNFKNIYFLGQVFYWSYSVGERSSPKIGTRVKIDTKGGPSLGEIRTISNLPKNPNIPEAPQPSKTPNMPQSAIPPLPQVQPKIPQALAPLATVSPNPSMIMTQPNSLLSLALRPPLPKTQPKVAPSAVQLLEKDIGDAIQSYANKFGPGSKFTSESAALIFNNGIKNESVSNALRMQSSLSLAIMVYHKKTTLISDNDAALLFREISVKVPKTFTHYESIYYLSRMVLEGRSNLLTKRQAAGNLIILNSNNNLQFSPDQKRYLTGHLSAFEAIASDYPSNEGVRLNPNPPLPVNTANAPSPHPSLPKMSQIAQPKESAPKNAPVPVTKSVPSVLGAPVAQSASVALEDFNQAYRPLFGLSLFERDLTPETMYENLKTLKKNPRTTKLRSVKALYALALMRAHNMTDKLTDQKAITYVAKFIAVNSANKPELQKGMSVLDVLTKRMQ